MREGERRRRLKQWHFVPEALVLDNKEKGQERREVAEAVRSGEGQSGRVIYR